ncbi:tRNA (N6-threonylcarbamoyladenosine(37)-N6)-methyltransferase TrmO [Candidatus Bathyarchaeota archaeon]|nr:tRNA (N6-threonylcarbamoyladenosine(37)-N6)-methyltransferase TrmO [Candidatus Bathyarchaeota archaeon]
MFSSCEIFLQPIGIIQTETLNKHVRDKNIFSKIVIRDEYTKALDGLEEFSHLFVLFWLHKITKEDRLLMKVHPLGRKDMPLLGIFATRTPCRPNPIGLTRVKLISINDNILTVQGLDAYNNTPVLDIKPFYGGDTTIEFRIHKWWKKLEKRENIDLC